MATLSERLAQAEEYLNRGQDTQALPIYLELADNTDAAHVACFRLGEIYNRRNEPLRSYESHQKAFLLSPNLARDLVPREHPSYEYTFQPVTEKTVENCPLCGSPGKPFACYNDVTGYDFIADFHPIRLWMQCENCRHLFAHSYPADLSHLLSSSTGNLPHLEPKTQLLPTIGATVNKILKYAPGYQFLDVGVGAGEMLAVAQEYLFNVTGVDVRPAYAQGVGRMLGITVHTQDFLKFAPGQKYDVISMGDVLEHLENPVAAVAKAADLLNDQGVLWVSTPNFDSAYTRIMKDRDPMWRVVEHLNYFSFHSLFNLLEKYGFTIMDYAVSAHYNGSMEVLAVKQ